MNLNFLYDFHILMEYRISVTTGRCGRSVGDSTQVLENVEASQDYNEVSYVRIHTKAVFHAHLDF